MQGFLSFLIEAIAFASVVYFAIGFVLTVRVRSTSPRAKIEMIEEVVETIEVVAVEVVAIVVPEPAIAWAALSPERLRKECSARSIKWRDAHGRNKHLRKAEMVTALAGSSA
jgi:hypothetical protein